MKFFEIQARHLLNIECDGFRILDFTMKNNIISISSIKTLNAKSRTLTQKATLPTFKDLSDYKECFHVDIIIEKKFIKTSKLYQLIIAQNLPFNY